MAHLGYNILCVASGKAFELRYVRSCLLAFIVSKNGSKLLTKRFKIVPKFRKCRDSRMKKGSSESVHRNILTVVYIPFVQGSQMKVHFKIEKMDLFLLGNYNI